MSEIKCDTKNEIKLTDDANLNVLIKKYLTYEKIDEFRQSIENLLKNNEIEEVTKLIGKRLTFGTAGIRGSMGAGFSRMNDLVIIQTSQGMASYLLSLDSKVVRERGVIIGHDARHNSSRFARLAALAFLQKGIPVYFCEHIIPTPLVAFGVTHYNCYAGIVVTASHNPREDNGYKVYWSNGAQILSPHDKYIQESITSEENQEPWPLAWKHEYLSTESVGNSQLPSGWDGLISRVYGDLSKSYFGYIASLVSDRREQNQTGGICITYTAMHGVGHTFLSRAFDIAGFEEIFPVELQKKPDPEFSTVKFPNPEEAGALDLAFETAKHANSNLILANDPDSDRCAAAVFDHKTNYRRILTGNELGALLGWWIWHCYSNTNTCKALFNELTIKDDTNPTPSIPNQVETDTEMSVIKRKRKEPSNCYMISTAVSSKFLQSMARVEGFQFVETLTGFKYMGNVANDLIKNQDKCVLFAYEEAIGYMVDSSILDKDGISAAVQVAQCAAYLSSNYERTLEEQLDHLYTIYGYHFNLNSYFKCSDPVTIQKIFHDLQANYPSSFSDDLNRRFEVTRVRDLNNGYDSGESNNKATLPSSSSSFMITFFIDDDITFTMRTSGTEPKIKYYSEIVAKLPEGKLNEDSETHLENLKVAKEAAKERLRLLVDIALEECLKPEEYKLEPADS